MHNQTLLTQSSKFLTDAEARQLYRATDAAHDFDHVERVTRMAEQIAQAEGADIEVVRLAALFHDVPTPHTANERHAHHLAAADFARQWLTERHLEAGRIANVVHCIEAHRFRDRSIQPQTLEAQCLYDADKLDSIGAIGVGRAFAYAGSHDARLWTTPWRAAPPNTAKPTGPDYTPVHEFVYKLQLIVETLYTETARSIGRQRHLFMQTFFDQLDAEMRQVYGAT